MRCLLTLAAIMAAPAFGQDWNGSVSNLWSNGANWTPNTVPNSAAAAVSITNATNNPVLIDVAPTISTLTLGALNSLNLNNGESLTFDGPTIANNGNILINSSGSFTDVILNLSGGTLTLSGTGTFTLSNGPNNRVFATTAATFVNQSAIEGAGQLGINNGGFGFTLNNQGTINANQSNALQVAPTNTVTNTGTLEATSGGTLNLIATVTNTGGTILGTGASSVVELSGSTITSGTLTTASGGTIQNSGTATVDGATISSGSTLTLVNGSSTTLMNTITNNGTIAQNSTGSFTDLHISGAVTLTGPGSLTMSNSPNNRVFATGSDSLLNDVNHTIQGSGQLGINNAGFAFTLDNKGTINANQSAALQVAPTGLVTNTGTLEASGGGTLNLIATVNNSGGTILATGASSVVDLNGSTIIGGTLTTASGGTIQNSGTATVDGATISSGSTLTLVNGSSTTLVGTINNNGTIALSSTGSFTDLHISGAVTLTGPGSLTMSNSPNNRVFATGGSDSLVNDVNHTIEGAGQLGINNAGFAFDLTNNGTINANQSGGTLQVAPTNPVTNNALLEATNGGTLALTGGTFNNAGTILATGASSFVDLSGSTINGGTLTTTSGGAIGNIGTATVNGVTISSGSTLTGVNSSSTTLIGTINNSGTIFLDSTGSFTDVHISGPVTLTGTGVLALSDSPNNRVFATGTDSLINDVNHTIQGSGELGINNAGFAFDLINNGTINANQSNPLQVAPSNPMTNNGLLEATNGGTLLLTGGTFSNAGTILATGASSLVDLNGSTITGGTLTTASGGTIQNSGTATVNGVTISSGSTLTLVNSSSTTLMNTITNNGTIALNSTGSFTDLHISGAVTLTGTGVLSLSDSPNNRVFATGTDSLINDVNHTIQGSGQLGINNAGFAFDLTNNGTIIANQSNALNIAPGNVTNNGTFQVNAGSTMVVLTNLTNFSGNTLTGGSYNVIGTLLSPGTLEIDALGTFGGEIVNNAAAIILDGVNSNFVDAVGNDALSNLANNTALGLLTIKDGRAFNTSGDFTNAGSADIGAGSVFNVKFGAGAYTQSGGSTQVDGTLTANTGIDVSGGIVDGMGTIFGNVLLSGGTMEPGDAPGTPGTLAIVGNYDQTGGIFDELISSTGNGLLDVFGGATLGPGADLNIDLLGGFTPTLGEKFTIMEFTTGSGTFANAPGGTFNMDGFDWFIAYNPNNIVLTFESKGGGPPPVPEPSSYILLATALVAIIGGSKLRAKSRERASTPR